MDKAEERRFFRQRNRLYGSFRESSGWVGVIGGVHTRCIECMGGL